MIPYCIVPSSLIPHTHTHEHILTYTSTYTYEQYAQDSEVATKKTPRINLHFSGIFDCFRLVFPLVNPWQDFNPQDMRRVLATTQELTLNAILNLRVRFRTETRSKEASDGRRGSGGVWNGCYTPENS